MQPFPDDAARLLGQAAQDYAAGAYDAAGLALERAERLDPGLPALWELKGAVALAQGDAGAAVAALRRAMALVAGSIALHQNLATALLAAGAAGEAADVLRRALELAGEQVRPAAERRGIAATLAGVLWQAGQHGAAIDVFAAMAAETPDDPETLGRLAMALAWCDRALEAAVVFVHMALQRPLDPVPARDAAQVLAALGAAEAARAWFGRALALRADEKVAREGLAQATGADAVAPEHLAVTEACRAVAAGDADAHFRLARCLLAETGIGHRDTAVAALRRALALDGGHEAAMALLAEALAGRGDMAAAEDAVRAMLRLAPGDGALHARLGDLLKAQWRAAEAAACYRAALGLMPAQPHLLVNLADALLAEGPSDEAVALLRQAVALDPELPAPRAWLGMALGLAQRPGPALEALRPAIAQRPDEPNWRFAAAHALLAQGAFEEGWREYAWRWRMPEQKLALRSPADPFRRPDPAGWGGRTVLLYAEQGNGDTLQFLRYARLVIARGARVLLEVQPGLKTLAAGLPGVAGVYAQGEDVPAHDVAVPLLHLPWAFDTRLDSIPATVPYLRADLTRAAGFRRRMQGLPGLKVGLVWSGDPRPHLPNAALVDRRRSMTLAALAPLAAVPGVVFVSLQKGAAAAQASQPPAGMVLHDWTDELEDFAATAALMAALDLVITVDSAPVHLAGALGRPVWLLNRFDSCWRWMLEREDSPWYPTLRQFRQMRPGDWGEVVSRVAEAQRQRAT